MDFGTQMRTLRVLRKMNQDELAKLVGISRPYLTAIELGTLNPTAEFEARIRAALNWPADADEAFAILAGEKEKSHV